MCGAWHVPGCSRQERLPARMLGPGCVIVLPAEGHLQPPESLTAPLLASTPNHDTPGRGETS